MPRGRPAKPLAEKIANGTHRKDRKTVADAAPPPPAKALTPPPEVTPALRPKWDAIVADLEAVGVVTDTDLIRLARAFRQLGNAILFQTQLEECLIDPEASPSDKAKFQSSVTSATASFVSIVAELERSVKLRPRTEKGMDWES
jgi:hypothetical protein